MVPWLHPQESPAPGGPTALYALRVPSSSSVWEMQYKVTECAGAFDGVQRCLQRRRVAATVRHGVQRCAAVRDAACDGVRQSACYRYSGRSTASPWRAAGEGEETRSGTRACGPARSPGCFWTPRRLLAAARFFLPPSVGGNGSGCGPHADRTMGSKGTGADRTRAARNGNGRGPDRRSSLLSLGDTLEEQYTPTPRPRHSCHNVGLRHAPAPLHACAMPAPRPRQCPVPPVGGAAAGAPRSVPPALRGRMDRRA
eukprot:gene22839-biopygen20775